MGRVEGMASINFVLLPFNCLERTLVYLHGFTQRVEFLLLAIATCSEYQI